MPSLTSTCFHSYQHAQTAGEWLVESRSRQSQIIPLPPGTQPGTDALLSRKGPA